MVLSYLVDDDGETITLNKSQNITLPKNIYVHPYSLISSCVLIRGLGDGTNNFTNVYSFF